MNPTRFFLVSLAACLPAAAQNIAGKVVDKMLKPVADAKVCVQGTAVCTMSGADGAFHLTSGSGVSSPAFQAAGFSLEYRRGALALVSPRAAAAAVEWLDARGRLLAPVSALWLAAGGNTLALPALPQSDLVFLRVRGEGFTVTWKGLLQGSYPGPSASPEVAALAKAAAAPVLEATKPGMGSRVYNASQETETGVEIMLPNEGEVAIFDNKTMAGWKGRTDTWSIKDNALHGMGTRSAILSDGDYDNFRLFVRSRNVNNKSHMGICFWGQRDPAFGFGQCTLVMPHDGGQWDYHNGAPNGGGVAHQSPPPKATGSQVPVQTEFYYTELLVDMAKKTIKMESNGVFMIDHHNDPSLTLWKGPIGFQIHDNTIECEHKDIFVEANPKEADKLLYLK